MSKKRPANIGASVRQRLLNQARTDKRTFSELLQYFAMDRFLYRISISDYADSFILKGALMLQAWKSPVFRPTMDIDMLAHRISNEISAQLLLSPMGWILTNNQYKASES